MGHKLEKDNDVTSCRHDVIIIFFDIVFFLLSSLVTGQVSSQYHHCSEVMTIYCYKGLTTVTNLARMSQIKCY